MRNLSSACQCMGFMVCHLYCLLPTQWIWSLIWNLETDCWLKWANPCAIRSRVLLSLLHWYRIFSGFYYLASWEWTYGTLENLQYTRSPSVSDPLIVGFYKKGVGFYERELLLVWSRQRWEQSSDFLKHQDSSGGTISILWSERTGVWKWPGSSHPLFTHWVLDHVIHKNMYVNGDPQYHLYVDEVSFRRCN